MLKKYMRRNEKEIGSRTSGRMVEKPEVQMRYNWHRYFQKIWMFAGMLILSFLMQLLISSAQQSRIQQGIAGEVLRFHVLANSDSGEDQAVKLQVRDAVLQATAADFAPCQSREQTIQTAARLLPQMKAAAEEALQQAGCPDPVQVSLVKMYFETREYDGTILPAGYYDAVRIELGEAKGHNWWCVLFPQLCIGTASESEEREQIEKLAEGPEYRLSFALVEWLERLLAAAR